LSNIVIFTKTLKTTFKYNYYFFQRIDKSNGWSIALGIEYAEQVGVMKTEEEHGIVSCAEN